MPLKDFINETIDLLHAEPTPDEIIVERARFLRTAGATGHYDSALKMLSEWKAAD